MGVQLCPRAAKVLPLCWAGRVPEYRPRRYADARRATSLLTGILPLHKKVFFLSKMMRIPLVKDENPLLVQRKMRSGSCADEYDRVSQQRALEASGQQNVRMAKDPEIIQVSTLSQHRATLMHYRQYMLIRHGLGFIARYSRWFGLIDIHVNTYLGAWL